MIERGGHLRFPLKAAAGRGIGQLVGKKLDRYGPVELGIVRAKDYAQAPFADGSLDAIKSQVEARRNLRHGGVTLGQ